MISAQYVLTEVIVTKEGVIANESALATTRQPLSPALVTINSIDNRLGDGAGTLESVFANRIRRKMRQCGNGKRKKAIERGEADSSSEDGDQSNAGAGSGVTLILAFNHVTLGQRQTANQATCGRSL